MKYLITGGAGFIGSNFCHYIYNDKDEFVVIDALTYAGNIEFIEDLLDKENFKFVHGNICDESLVDSLFLDEQFDVVVNFAAESHVETSTVNPQIFIDTNITGVRVLLDACKKHGIKRFHQVSTDEVYGEILDDSQKFFEDSPLNPKNPYSVTKAAADLLVMSYHNIFGLNTTISRCSNNYGPNQHTEKFISRAISQLMQGKKVTVHGDGGNSREWIYVLDHCGGIVKILDSGKSGEIYNIGSGVEKTNLEIAKILCKIFDKSEENIEFVENRITNDKRYSLSCDKISKELGFASAYSFEETFSKVVDWYKSKN